MNFVNAKLESGVYGTDGSTYRFDTICSGIDAIVEITGRSSADVQLSNIDTSGPGLGYDKAFQPVLGIPGTAPAYATWWMDFKVTFVETGTFNPVIASQFYASGIDIDGDGLTINEWAEMYKIESIDSAVVNSLTFTQLAPYFQGYDYRVEGIIANAPGIDTSAKNVMATYRYALKSEVRFRIGASTAENTSTAAMRLNSIWFRDIYVGVPLAVKFTAFTAVKNNEQVKLQWQVTQPSSPSYFIVEESTDGIRFVEKAIINTDTRQRDEEEYQYVQDLKNEVTPCIYYRVRSVDQQGRSFVSETRMICLAVRNNNAAGIFVFPNPFQYALKVTIPDTWQTKKVLFELSAANGSIVYTRQTSNSGQTEILNIDQLSPGFYLLKASCNGNVLQQKIIRQ
jgi:hypothetical protein